MAGWTQYVSVAFAVIGLAQAVFLCLLLRSEGDRAFGANRWMMLFIVTIAFNLIEDVADTFVSGDSEALLDLFFGPINFVIAPAIYLYFREISGNPVRRPWAHFILPLIVLNLMAWATAFGGRTGDGLSDGLSLRGAVDALCWGGIFVQITVYFVLLWHVSCRYFRQTQEQLGADRKSMQRWMGIILGGLTLVFVIVAVGRIVEIYVANSTEMFGTEIAFTLVLFAMSYETATRPVLFVMPDWPSNFEADEFIALDSFTSHGTPDAAKATTLTVPSSPQNASGNDGYSPGVSAVNEPRDPSDPHLDGAPLAVNAAPNGPNDINDSSAVRPLLDDDGVARVMAKLDDLQRRGDILRDPLVSMPKLARAVGVSPNQLSYVLNQHMGQNFFDFVNRARVEEARTVLLLEPDRTILDIALSVGFNSKSTFNLAFKKMTGETPSALRARRSGEMRSETSS
ncbi:helix-turn-helix domain-containing protein [Thalassospira lucentensis]|uniref:helix-turn-helix domain-containing protein n=1 Tax=Thalassospira lucentensis TaxID=168935 RepID=UPI003AA8B0D4